MCQLISCVLRRRSFYDNFLLFSEIHREQVKNRYERKNMQMSAIHTFHCANRAFLQCRVLFLVQCLMCTVLLLLSGWFSRPWNEMGTARDTQTNCQFAYAKQEIVCVQNKNIEYSAWRIFCGGFCFFHCLILCSLWFFVVFWRNLLPPPPRPIPTSSVAIASTFRVLLLSFVCFYKL